MRVQIIQREFVQTHSGYGLTVVARIDAETTLRVRVRRDAYDSQGTFVAEIWGRGITPQGWREVVRYAPEACKGLPSYVSGEDATEDAARVVAQNLARDALRVLGFGLESSEKKSVEFAWGEVEAAC